MAEESEDPVRRERELAWIGDAVLALFARQWILRHYGRMDSDLFAGMTSNQFLSCIGNPTAVEAKIGSLFRTSGLEGAFEYLEKEVVPLFLKQQRNRDRR